MKKIFAIFGILFTLFVGSFLFFTSLFNSHIYSEHYFPPDAPPKIIPQSQQLHREMAPDTPERAVISPTPLRGKPLVGESLLTTSGIIRETNEARKKQNLPALGENPALDEAAILKASDMLEKQYFAHISPSGKSAGDLAKDSGYEYILIGENLALGGFDGDWDVVNAWMQSPGHRENILNQRFQEIGVGAIRGRFEGRDVWVAVQIFGLPLDACPVPDDSLRIVIEQNRTLLDEMQMGLEIKKSQLAEDREKLSRKEYNREVEEYNEIVARYNGLVGDTKYLVSKYNAQVKITNECRIGEG